MLYALHEFGYALATPWQVLARLNIAMFSLPFLSDAPLSREIVAGSDLLIRMTKHYEKPVFGITDVLREGKTLPVQEQVALEKPFCRLLHFSVPNQPKPKLLMVAPLSGHHSTLLRETVHKFLQDYDVFVTDWRDARIVPVSAGPFGLDDYIDYLQDFIHLLGPGAHIVGVCQPAVPVMAAVALMSAQNDPDTPASMILMGGPIDTRRGETAVNAFAHEHTIDWFESHVIQQVPWTLPGAGRKVYPGFIQHASFVAMNADRHVRAYREYFENMIRGDLKSASAHRKFYDEYNAVLDLPAEFYLDTLRVVFQDYALPMGTMTVRGELVQPAAISNCALMTIEGERDDITGMGQTEAAQDLCTGLPAAKKRHLMAEGVGHYGIFNGRRFRDMIYPQIHEFIEANSAKQPVTVSNVRKLKG